MHANNLFSPLCEPQRSHVVAHTSYNRRLRRECRTDGRGSSFEVSPRLQEVLHAHTITGNRQRQRRVKGRKAMFPTDGEVCDVEPRRNLLARWCSTLEARPRAAVTLHASAGCRYAGQPDHRRVLEHTIAEPTRAPCRKYRTPNLANERQRPPFGCVSVCFGDPKRQRAVRDSQIFNQSARCFASECRPAPCAKILPCLSGVGQRRSTAVSAHDRTWLLQRKLQLGDGRSGAKQQIESA